MNPITREESLLDGQDLTPITRKEQFIKRIYDKTQEIPEPITREEYFLKKAGEGTSPVAVEQLNVTENGTYSETGKAYSPVIVEVPEPTLITKTITENGTYTASADNADGYSQVTVNVPYMEKKSALGDIASFSDGAGYPFLKVKANINTVQDLHGYDYPWVGGAGKNKINAPDITLADAGDIYNGSINLAAGTYTLSSSNTTTSVTVEGVSGIMPLTFTLANAITTIQITASGAGEFKNIQIESGSSATSFAPYSNICPISGFTGVNVSVTGKNLLDINAISEIKVSDTAYRNGVLFDKAGTYTVSAQNSGGYLYCRTFDADRTIKTTYNVVSQDTITNATFTISNGEYFTVYDAVGSTPLAVSIQRFEDWQVQVEKNSSATSYEAHNRHVYPISWQDEAGIVYGGYVDLVSGVLTVTKVGIAEYNGETLPSAWISDRDRYVAGSTPTIGAQVVYDLATPQTYQLTPQQINTLIGQNNVWNNTNGQTEVEYIIPIE